LVYPNPANDFVNVEIASETDGYIFQITNVFGQELKTVRNTGKKTVFGISDLAPGLYFLNVKATNGQSATYCISKQ